MIDRGDAKLMHVMHDVGVSLIELESGGAHGVKIAKWGVSEFYHRFRNLDNASSA